MAGAVARQGRQVVVLDLRGRGASPATGDWPRHLRLGEARGGRARGRDDARPRQLRSRRPLDGRWSPCRRRCSPRSVSGVSSRSTPSAPWTCSRCRRSPPRPCGSRASTRRPGRTAQQCAPRASWSRGKISGSAPSPTSSKVSSDSSGRGRHSAQSPRTSSTTCSTTRPRSGRGCSSRRFSCARRGGSRRSGSWLAPVSATHSCARLPRRSSQRLTPTISRSWPTRTRFARSTSSWRGPRFWSRRPNLGS